MKNYSKIEEYNKGTKFYYNENGLYHRLIGPAVEWSDGDKIYYINNINYMDFSKNSNKLYIHPQILELNSEYEKYIKQNIKDLIQEYNTKIILYDLEKEQINNLPNWLKDLMIL